jgi:hypothetical protein
LLSEEDAVNDIVLLAYSSIGALGVLASLRLFAIARDAAETNRSRVRVLASRKNSRPS